MKYFLVFLTVFVCVYARAPSYIKPCSQSDPNFNKCAKKRAEDALPFVIKGDREYHIPNLKPLKLPEVHVEASKNLDIKFTNLKIYGLENAEIRDINMDVEKKRAEIKVFFDKISLIGHYNVHGKILILPIEGNGPCNMSFSRPLFTYTFTWTLKDKGGVTYAQIADHNIDYVLEKAYFNLENLFNGDQRLGNEMNKFLNENWDEVLKDLGGAITETVSAVCTSIARGVFDNVPYDELLLP